MSGHTNDRTRSDTQGRILHLREIQEITSSKVGNEVTQKLISLGATMRFEIGPDGSVVTRILDNKGSDYCTFADFNRSFNVGNLLREILDKTGKGGPAEEVIIRIASHAIKQGLEESTMVLPGNKAQANILANHIKNHKKVLDAFKVYEKAFKGHALVVDFKALLDASLFLFGEAHLRLAEAKEVSLSRDVYPQLAEKHGIPVWFINQIKSPNTILANMKTNKPYRLFFQSKGKGSIGLTHHEYRNSAVQELIPNVLSNSNFVADLVEKLVSRSDDPSKVVVPYVPTAADEAYLSDLQWPVVPAYTNAEDFLKEKLKDKLCDMVPWGSHTYKSSVERFRAALLRVTYLETSKIEDNSPFWTAIMGKDIEQEIGVSIWEQVVEKDDVNERIDGFWKTVDDERIEAFTKVFVGSLSAFEGGPVQVALKEMLKGIETGKAMLERLEKEANDAKALAGTSGASKPAGGPVSAPTGKTKEEIKFLTTKARVASIATDPLAVPISKSPAEFWEPNGLTTLVPTLTSEEVTKRDNLVQEILGTEPSEPEERITANHPADGEVIKYLKEKKYLLKDIGKLAKDRLTKLITSFMQKELQLDVARTVIGTVERFKRGIAEDNEPDSKEEDNNPFDL